MLVVDLRDFGGGKIFNDQFNLVLPATLCEGAKEFEIKYRGNILGNVDIISSFLCSSFSTNQDLAFKLSNQKMLAPGRDYLVTVRYKERNITAHGELMQEWWNGVKTSQQILQP